MKIHPLVKEYSLHLEALCVIILLLIVWSYAYNDYAIKKEINENCGWGEDNYYCYCEKSASMAIENKINQNFKINLSNLNLEDTEDVAMDK